MAAGREPRLDLYLPAPSPTVHGRTVLLSEPAVPSAPGRGLAGGRLTYPVLLKSTCQKASESAKRRTRWFPWRLAARAVPRAGIAPSAAWAAEPAPSQAARFLGPTPIRTHRILIGQDRGVCSALRGRALTRPGYTPPASPRGRGGSRSAPEPAGGLGVLVTPCTSPCPTFGLVSQSLKAHERRVGHALAARCFGHWLQRGSAGRSAGLAQVGGGETLPYLRPLASGLPSPGNCARIGRGAGQHEPG